MAASATSPRREKAQTLPLLCVEAILKFTPTSKLARLYSNAVPLPGDWGLGLETVLEKRSPLSIRKYLPDYDIVDHNEVFDAAEAHVASVKHLDAFRYSPLLDFIESAFLIVRAANERPTRRSDLQLYACDGEAVLSNLKNITALTLVLSEGDRTITRTRCKQKDLLAPNLKHLLPQLESFVCKPAPCVPYGIKQYQALRDCLRSMSVPEMPSLRRLYFPGDALRWAMKLSNSGNGAVSSVLSSLSSLGIWQSEAAIDRARTYVLRRVPTHCRELTALCIVVSGEFKPYLDAFRALTGLKTLGMYLNVDAIEMNGLSYDGSETINSVLDLRIVSTWNSFDPGTSEYKMTPFFPNVIALAVQADGDFPDTLELATSIFGEGQLFPVVAKLSCFVTFRGVFSGLSDLSEFLANPHLPETVDLSPIIFEALSHEAGELSAIYRTMQASSIKSLLLRGPVNREALPRLREQIHANKENAKITAWQDQDLSAQSEIPGYVQISEQTDIKIIGTKTSGGFKGEQFSIRVCHELAKLAEIFDC